MNRKWTRSEPESLLKWVRSEILSLKFVLSVILNHRMLSKDHNIRIVSSLQVSSDLFDFDKSSHKLWGSMWHSWTKPLIWGLPIERRFYTSSIWSIGTMANFDSRANSRSKIKLPHVIRVQSFFIKKAVEQNLLTSKVLFI